MVSHEDRVVSGEPKVHSGEEAEGMGVKGLPRGSVEGVVVKTSGSGVRLLGLKVQPHFPSCYLYITLGVYHCCVTNYPQNLVV